MMFSIVSFSEVDSPRDPQAGTMDNEEEEANIIAT
jgi:hypothetical protein